MSHVGQQVRAYIISQLAHALVLDKPTVSRCSSHDDLWSVEVCQLLHAVVVDDASLLIQSVGKCLVVLGDGRYLLCSGLVAMRQVAAMGEVETEDAIMGVEDGGVGVKIGWRPREC